MYFFKNPKECDFITEERGKITSAIQVCYELTQENRERELSGLYGAMAVHGLRQGIILVYLQEETITQGDTVVHMVPAMEIARSGRKIPHRIEPFRDLFLPALN